MKEEWRDINGFEGYQISNLGNVRSFKHSHNLGKHLSKCITRGGYLFVILRDCEHKKRFKTVHRLVAEHFIRNPLGLPQVNHIDGDKTNNYSKNLEWCNASENAIHAVKTGLRDITKLNKPVAQMTSSRQIIKIFGSLKVAAEEMELNNSAHIVECCKGKRNQCKGFKWKYADEEEVI